MRLDGDLGMRLGGGLGMRLSGELGMRLSGELGMRLGEDLGMRLQRMHSKDFFGYTAVPLKLLTPLSFGTPSLISTVNIRLQ